MLADAAPGLPASVLRDRGVTADVIRRLAARGLVAIRDERDERDPFERAGMAVDARRRAPPDRRAGGGA